MEGEENTQNTTRVAYEQIFQVADLDERKTKIVATLKYGEDMKSHYADLISKGM
jgi:hypothetical protein